MAKNTEFVDAQAMHLQNANLKHSKRFKVPTVSELAKLKVDDSVEIEYAKKRFWVSVTAVDGDNVSGLADDGKIISELKLWDTITFQKKNIYRIISTK
jgi:hypothetical protein